ncbi:uncharacterized protein RJT21DRAFT_115421 [Scheffersomyces amazonensis]|uniref:uncharacterized protein n=1 Tax=Scheffersomyces amazonensis TaxID=1078765 RepID=UPI00315D1974
MVSFSCEVCNDTVVKKKLDQHSQRCYGAYYTCIDCSTTFEGTSYRQHTSCISEAEKYEKALYKGPKKQQKKQPEAPKKVEIQPVESKPESKKEVTSDKVTKTKKSKSSSSTLSNLLSSNKKEGLYKIVKKLSKESSKDIKEILKTLKVTKSEDGKIIIE